METVNIIITAVVTSVLFLAFSAVLFPHNPPKKEKKKTREPLQDLHCFQCEIEMPVKEKDGRLYCSNCGLRH